MKFAAAAALLVRDPAVFSRKALARLSGALGVPSGSAVRWIGKVAFPCDFRLDPYVRDMYFGAYEAEEIAFLRRTLRRGDVFVDVGANIGYFSAVAASIVGPEGQVHSFEPVPEYFARLSALRDANPGYHIHAVNAALGASEGALEIRVGEGNIGWNTLVPGFMRDDEARATYTVPVRRLDAYLADRGIDRVALVKLDVEGYELPVLEGLEGLFARGVRPVVLCEVAPAAYPLLGRDLTELFALMGSRGYAASLVDGRAALPGEVLETTNVVFRPS